MHVAFVCRHLDPARPGGDSAIAVAALAATLAEDGHEVTLLVSSAHASTGLPGVNVLTAPEPAGDPGCHSTAHEWSLRAFEALVQAFGDRGPDVLEFPDRGAEAFVSLQATAARTGWLRDTVVAVRTHGTTELMRSFDGGLRDDWESRIGVELERFCLRSADRVVWPCGGVGADYARFYRATGLAPAKRIPVPLPADARSPAPVAENSGGPLRILCLGEVGRAAGTLDLADAIVGMPGDDVRITVAGPDTLTDSLGQSALCAVQLVIAGDARVALAGYDPVSRDALLASHELLIAPARWACWPEGVQRALAAGLPVLATPVGGLTELAGDGHCGWLADGIGEGALRRGLARVLAERERIGELRAGGAPARHIRELCDPGAICAAYEALARAGTDRRSGGRGRRRSSAPLVSFVIPHYRQPALLEHAVESVAAQSHPSVETIVVDDGSGPDPDTQAVLDRLDARPGVTVVTRTNGGVGAARNAGFALARGRYVVTLDGDDRVLPTFAARCCAVFEERPELALVATFTRCVGPDGSAPPGHAAHLYPIGMWPGLPSERNLVGIPIAMHPRELLDAGWRYPLRPPAYEDWLLYAMMVRRGLRMAIVPEVHSLYLVRPDSVLRALGHPHHESLRAEVAGRVRASDLLDEAVGT